MRFDDNLNDDGEQERLGSRFKRPSGIPQNHLREDSEDDSQLGEQPHEEDSEDDEDESEGESLEDEEDE